MISRSQKTNFFVRHYDRVVAAVGLLALAGSCLYFFSASNADSSDAVLDEKAKLNRLVPDRTGVTDVDMSLFHAAKRIAKTPSLLAELDGKSQNFLASERRILCKKCKKAIFIEIKKGEDSEELPPTCQFCGEIQSEAKKIVLDADGDGLPDKWEKSVGLDGKNAADADADMDGDDFSNKEEYLAGTKINDKSDHPDYLDFVKIVLPLKETYLPFVFRKANQIPGSWRCEFFDPKKKDDYNRIGLTMTARIGEEIADTGYVVEKYVKKEVRQKIKGGEGLTRAVDVSEALVKRKSDGKVIKLVIDNAKTPKPVAVDVQAVLKYDRAAKSRDFTVVPGDQITLGLEKWKIVSVQPEGKGAKITFENSVTGKKRTLSALEQ